nr:hypothetical protein [uncultured Capnocytophaga sp.]
MTDNKRTLYFMLITLGIVAVIALYTWVSSTDFNFSNTTSVKHTSNDSTFVQTLKNNIDAIEVATISPQQYNNLRVEIISYYDQGDLTESLKNSLLSRLNDNYIAKAFTKTQEMLRTEPLPEAEINKLLTHLTSLKADKTKIQQIKSKLQWYHYYTESLPAELKAFAKRPSSMFKDSTHEEYKKKLENIKYKEFAHFKKVKEVQAEGEELLKQCYIRYIEYIDKMYNLND